MSPMDYIKDNISISSPRKLLYRCVFQKCKIETEEGDEDSKAISGKVRIRKFFQNL